MAIPDLDKPLDELIKQKKSKPRSNRSMPNSSKRDGRASQSGGNNQQRSNRSSSHSTGHSNKAPTQRNTRDRMNINSRLSTAGNSINERLGKVDKNARGYRGVLKPERSSSGRTGSELIIKSNRPITSTPLSKATTKIDPKQLVITKSIAPLRKATPVRSSKSSRTEDIIIKSVVPRAKSVQKRRVPEEKPALVNDVVEATNMLPPHLESTEDSLPKRNIVLICNLDPRATAEDVGEACGMFGPILSCDMLLDPMGRPLNEAEIEFVYASSAKECVEKLDNNIADGRVLHVKLQDHATLPVKPRYSSRTVVASSRVKPDAVYERSSVAPHSGMAGQPVYGAQAASVPPPPPTYQQQQYYQQFHGRY